MTKNKLPKLIGLNNPLKGADFFIGGKKVKEERFWKEVAKDMIPIKKRQQAWIDVNTRLPKQSMNVLVADEKGRVVIAWYFENEWRGDMLYHPIAYWRPLPKPPQQLIINNLDNEAV